MIERTAAGTLRCQWCELEWIGEDQTEHADPACLMFVFSHLADDD